MKTKPFFKIVILEDDDFYNKLLTKHIDSKINKLSLLYSFGYEIKSYTSCKDCTLNFENNTNLLFSDYYLGNGYNARYLLDFVKRRSSDCKVVVISQMQNMQTSVSTFLEGAYEFFRKDDKLLFNCSELAETVIKEKMGKKN